MTNDEIFDKIKKFTVEEAGKGGYTITENSALETDLDIYGDDAIEYLIDFGKEFNVDVSNFMAEGYFSGEGEFKLFPFLVTLFGIKKEPREKELTIKHLIKAVRAGRLDEEIIKS